MRGRGVETSVRLAAVGLLVTSLLVLGACGGQAVSIDWVDLVQWNGITYLPTPPLAAGGSTPALGALLGTTKRKLAGNETDPAYHLKNGDAAILEAGTPMFAVGEYRTTFRIAVTASGRTVIYEADTNPAARSGADLMDLRGLIDYIGVQGSDGRSELAAIHDAAVISRLVELVLQAPVDQSVGRPQAGTQYFLAFHFRDGTQSLRAYWPSTGELSRGILTRPEFASTILSFLPPPAA